jgi:hypothetical protein
LGFIDWNNKLGEARIKASDTDSKVDSSAATWRSVVRNIWLTDSSVNIKWLYREL